MTQQELEALINGMAGNNAAAKTATFTADEQLAKNQAAVTEAEGKRIKGIAKKLCAAHVVTLYKEQGFTFHLTKNIAKNGTDIYYNLTIRDSKAAEDKNEVGRVCIAVAKESKLNVYANFNSQWAEMRTHIYKYYIEKRLGLFVEQAEEADSIDSFELLRIHQRASCIFSMRPIFY